MKKEDLELQLGNIFVEIIDLYGPLLDSALQLNKPVSDVDDTIKIIIKLKFDVIPGLYDYAKETVPLAKTNGVFKWVFDSIEMYKKPILEQIKRRENEKE